MAAFRWATSARTFTARSGRPASHMVPRPDTYRPMWTKADGTIDTDAYIDFYREYIDKATVHDVAGFVLEPIQGWGGSIIPPDDFFPKLRAFCDELGILLMADEVLTSWGRTGKWLCLEHWDVVPDVVTIGKGFGNGFPVTCVAVREPYKESFEQISASSSYGGNPMACAAALASTEVIEEENLLEHAEPYLARWRCSGCKRCSENTRSSATCARRAA